MKKKYLLGLLATIIISCKKDLNQTSNPSMDQVDNALIKSKENARIVFSKTLAVALSKEPLLRAFLKSEAEKQFDKDNDVLFIMVKDQKLNDGETIYQKVVKYAESNDVIDNTLKVLPTMTIMIPTVPNFSALTWNTENEIPIVAIDPANPKSAVITYNNEGKRVDIPVGQVPGFPVIVVKENERVNVKVNGIDKSPKSFTLLQEKNIGNNTNSNSGEVFYNNNGIEFSFSNIAFKNLSTSTAGVVPLRSLPTIDNGRNGNTHPLDQIVVDAYNNRSSSQWQRDYIYYGINSNTGVTSGPFNPNIKEYITSITLKDNRYETIGDQTGDPIPTKASYSYGGGPIVAWTDGAYELKINVFLNSINNSTPSISYTVSASGPDLFSINYQQRGNTRYYDYVSVTAKEFFVDLPIVSWNLQNYASTWKFSVSEYDPSETITTTSTYSTQIANNFSYNVSVGTNVKVGAMFGTTTTTTNSQTYSIQTTLTSDDLGEGSLEFGDPIITGTHTVTDTRGNQSQYYDTWNVNTGRVLLAVEPSVKLIL